MINLISSLKTPDLINSIYEIFGGIFILDHCRVILKDKKVAGVSISSIIYFTSWTYWNVYYYTYLDQILSFWANAFMLITNTVYTILILRYYKK